MDEKSAKMDAGPVVGIDLGGTSMSIGVVDARGHVLGRAKRKTKASLGRDAVIARIVEGVSRACDDAKVALADVYAVGIGAPSGIDVPNGVVIRSGNLGWENLPLRAILRDALGKPVVLDNDVNVAAWGEFAVGAAKGREHALAVWVGTGVGGALVLNRRLFHGTFWTAGEIGQTIVTQNGAPGATTLEQQCSKVGISISLRRLLPFHPDSALHMILKEREELAASEPMSNSSVATAYHGGDELTTMVVEHAADTLGLAIANWITMLAIDMVVLGGGVTEALNAPFVKRVRKSFQHHVFPDVCRGCDIVTSVLVDDAGVIGAAMLARARLAEEVRGGIHS
ncbi:MAG: ROK family protein [Phycisphaerae bacterium]|nr:ROK family protein [Phycisphaerae bacterium]